MAERITAIAGAAREVIVNQAPISLHERDRDLLRLIRRQRFDRRIHIDRLQFAIIFHLHRMAHGKIQVRDAFVGFQHRGQDSIEIGNSHRNCVYSSVRSAVGSFRKGRNFFLSTALS